MADVADSISQIWLLELADRYESVNQGVPSLLANYRCKRGHRPGIARSLGRQVGSDGDKREMKPPTHRQRQIMQRRRRMDQGLYLAGLTQNDREFTGKMLDRSRGSDGDMTYRLTETGLEAKKAPVRIS